MSSDSERNFSLYSTKPTNHSDHDHEPVSIANIISITFDYMRIYSLLEARGTR